MTGDVREHLLSMAKEWDHLAEVLERVPTAESEDNAASSNK